MIYPSAVLLEPARRYVPWTLPDAPGIPLPAASIMQIKHDQEAQDDRQRIGKPEVFPMYLSTYSELTAAWQWFWFRQLIHSYTGFTHWDEKMLTKAEFDMLRGKWASLTKSSEAFTNHDGTNEDENIDVINLSGGTEWPGQEPLTCCGNIVKILGGPVRLGGEDVTPIETLRGDVSPPPIERINRLTRPDQIQCGTNVAADKTDPKNWKPIILPDGRYRVDPFPQLQDWNRDTLFCLRTHGKDAIAQAALFASKGINAPAGVYQRDGVWYAVNYIRSSRLLTVTDSVVPTPYVP